MAAIATTAANPTVSYAGAFVRVCTGLAGVTDAAARRRESSRLQPTKDQHSQSKTNTRTMQLPGQRPLVITTTGPGWTYPNPLHSLRMHCPLAAPCTMYGTREGAVPAFTTAASPAHDTVAPAGCSIDAAAAGWSRSLTIQPLLRTPAAAPLGGSPLRCSLMEPCTSKATLPCPSWHCHPNTSLVGVEVRVQQPQQERPAPRAPAPGTARAANSWRAAGHPTKGHASLLNDLSGPSATSSGWVSGYAMGPPAEHSLHVTWERGTKCTKWNSLRTQHSSGACRPAAA